VPVSGVVLLLGVVVPGLVLAPGVVVLGLVLGFVVPGVWLLGVWPLELPDCIPLEPDALEPVAEPVCSAAISAIADHELTKKVPLPSCSDPRSRSRH